MRPIHLAGGRQRDLYGPVISHRSSICIFMAPSSFLQRRGGGTPRRRRRGEAEWGAPLLSLNPGFQLDSDPLVLHEPSACLSLSSSNLPKDLFRIVGGEARKRAAILGNQQVFLLRSSRSGVPGHARRKGRQSVCNGKDHV